MVNRFVVGVFRQQISAHARVAVDVAGAPNPNPFPQQVTITSFMPLPARANMFHVSRYRHSWEAAAASGAHAISITSWNEWGEGTQIEPCQNWTDPDTGKAYKDYGAAGPWLYLNITQQEASGFIQQWHGRQAAQLAADEVAGDDSCSGDERQQGMIEGDSEDRVEL